MKIYDYTIEGYKFDSEEQFIEEFRDIVNCEYILEESQEDYIKYTRFVDSYKGYELYYDYGADYYFIADEED